MARTRTLALLGFAAAAACSMAAPAFAQGTTTFTIYIPQKLNLGVTPSVADPYPEIGTVKAIVSVASADPVTFTITDPRGTTQAFPSVRPSMAAPPPLMFAPGPVTAQDTVTLTANADPSDPSRYELDFILREDSSIDDIPDKNAKVAVFLDAGAGIPQGTFGNAFNTGFILNAGLEFIIATHFSLEGIFGYHNFPARLAGNLNIYQFSGNAKVYLNGPQNKLRPFVNGGIGGYRFDPGATNFGGNAGGGLLYSPTARIGLEGSYNFHAVNTPVAVTHFSSLQVGVRFVF
jgi:hypothetical protein